MALARVPPRVMASAPGTLLTTASAAAWVCGFTSPALLVMCAVLVTVIPDGAAASAAGAAAGAAATGAESPAVAVVPAAPVVASTSPGKIRFGLLPMTPTLRWYR